MANYVTSRGRAVTHYHIQPLFPRELTAAEIAANDNLVRQNFPRVTIVLSSTRQFNCHGKAHANSHGWFNDPNPFITDDYIPATMAQPKVNDVIVYEKDGLQTHSAVVTQVSGTSITQCRSKWGQLSEVLHGLNDVPSDYGSPIYCLRRRPGAFQIVKTNIMTKEIAQNLFNRVKNPENYFRIMLASSPEVARKIIYELDGVEEIIDAGESIKPELIDFFHSSEVSENENLLAIVLYLIQRNPFAELKEPLAHLMVDNELSFLTREMLPSAFLAVLGIDFIQASPFEVATMEAKKILNK